MIANQGQAPHDPPERGCRCSVHLSDHSIPWSNNHQNANAHNVIREEQVSNSQCKTFLFGKRSYKTWQEKEIVRLSGAADEQANIRIRGRILRMAP